MLYYLLARAVQVAETRFVSSVLSTRVLYMWCNACFKLSHLTGDGDGQEDAERWRYEPKGGHCPPHRSTDIMSGQPTHRTQRSHSLSHGHLSCLDVVTRGWSVEPRLQLRTLCPGPLLLQSSSGQTGALTFWRGGKLHLLRDCAPTHHVLTVPTNTDKITVILEEGEKLSHVTFIIAMLKVLCGEPVSRVLWRY
jgi:hypothetical protein